MKQPKKGRAVSKQSTKPSHDYVEQSDQHRQLGQVNKMPHIDREEFNYTSTLASDAPALKLKQMGGGLDVSAQAFVPKQPH